MTTAEKLIAIAENVPKVYEAGKAAGGGGVVAVEEKDVNFYDYDGTLLYSYTLAEAQSLTELPPIPTDHEHLIPYGWNWSLDGVRTLDYQADVGALYTTDDEATHLNVVLDKYALTVTLHFNQSVANGVEFDWGDGTSRESSSVSGQQSVSHQYSTPGNYTIRLHSKSGTYSIGANVADCNFLGGVTDVTLRALHCGKAVRFSSYALNGCYRLEKVTLHPDAGYYNIERDAFHNCYSLCWLNVFDYSIPANVNAFHRCFSLRGIIFGETFSGITSGILRECKYLKKVSTTKNVVIYETYNFYEDSNLLECRGKTSTSNIATFYGCGSMEKFIFSDASTGIGSKLFYGCASLREIDIPNGVTTINGQAFDGCSSLKRIRFRSITPPTVANANAFSGIPSDCVVEVPAASLSDYKNATNYGSIAAQMVGV